MDFKLAVVAYGIPGLAIVFGIPMALRLIPPNRYYGFRTLKAISSEEIWYRANRFCGCAMVIAGVIAIAHNVFLQQSHSDWSSSTQQFFMTISNSLLLLLGIWVSARYARKL